MSGQQTQKRTILVVGTEEAFYELIQNVSPERFSLAYAGDASEASLRMTKTLPDLIVLEAVSVRSELPSYLSLARGRGVPVLALVQAIGAVEKDDIPMALFDRVASLADRGGLMVAVRELLQERRQYPRVDANLEVVVAGDHTGEILDLSANALRLRTELTLEPDQTVDVSFDWGHQTISTRATVMSVSDRKSGVYVLRFDADDASVEAVDRLVRKVLEVEHYRSASGGPKDASRGPVAWQLARRAERALRQTGSFHAVSVHEKPVQGATQGVSARYSLGRRLGRWGIGDVHEAKERLSGRPVVLKILNEDLRADGPARARMEMEARSASELNAVSGVVHVRDFGSDGAGGLYYAMEPLQGEVLGTLLAAGESFSERDTAHLGVRLAQTLVRARELGHAHHDLCPENVFMQRGPGGTRIPRLLGFAGELPATGAPKSHARGAAYWPPEATECPTGEVADTYALCGLLRDIWESVDTRNVLPANADSARHKLQRLLWFGTADNVGDRYRDMASLTKALVSCSEALDRSILGPPASIPAPGDADADDHDHATPTDSPEPQRAGLDRVGPKTDRKRQDTLQPAELLARRQGRGSRWARIATMSGVAAAACLAVVLVLFSPWERVSPRGARYTATAAAQNAAKAASSTPALPPGPELVVTAAMITARGPFTDRPTRLPPAESLYPSPPKPRTTATPPAELATEEPRPHHRLSDSERRRFYLRRARWYLDHGQVAGAQRNLTRALRYGDGHRLRKLLARAAAELGRTAESIRHLTRAARLAPHSWRYRLQLGRLLIEVGRTREACRSFLAAFARNPEHAAIRNHHTRYCGSIRRATL